MMRNSDSCMRVVVRLNEKGGGSRIDTAMLIQQRAEPVRNCSLRISSRDDLIQLLGSMLVQKSGPCTKVTKGRLSYCQQRFICSRWSESVLSTPNRPQPTMNLP